MKFVLASVLLTWSSTRTAIAFTSTATFISTAASTSSSSINSDFVPSSTPTSLLAFMSKRFGTALKDAAFDPSSSKLLGHQEAPSDSSTTRTRTSTIGDILETLPKGSFQFQGDPAMNIDSIAWDFQKVSPGSLYFCLENEEFQEGHIQTNGLHHWTDAVGAGANCLVCKRGSIPVKPLNIGLIEVDDPNIAMAEMSRAFHCDPLSSLTMIGITGTNGKTTTTQMVNSVLCHIGARSGTIGTIGTFFPSGEKQEASHLSNPLATELFQIGSEMRQDDTEYLTMEVTSHAMAFDRNHAIDFDIAIFTNLSQDHLDFHKTMDSYKQAKMNLFRQLGRGDKKAYSIINIDDAHGSEFVDAVDKDLRRSNKVDVLTFGIENEQADFVAKPLKMTSTSSTFDVYFKGNRLNQIQLSMPGLFNIYNALGTFAASFAMGIKNDDIAEGLASARKVVGRFETVECGADFDVYVDYAHTPDALSKIIQEIRSLTDKRIITVFGCGGDRDSSKRGEMGRIACELSDVSVVTADNPRTESPDQIILDILDGIPANMRNNVKVKSDRRDAIYEALKTANTGDAVLIAGKGHETYQIIEHTTYPFSDGDVVQDFMKITASAAC